MTYRNTNVEVLDYSDVIQDFKGWAAMEDDKPGVSNSPKKPKLFYAQRGFCPACLKPTGVVYERRLSEGDPENYSFTHSERTQVWSCMRCGWWEIEHHNRQFSELLGGGEGTSLWHGVLSTFDAGDVDLPVATLRRYLADRPELVNIVHPQKLEELIKSVFSDFFDCEVHHVGGPADGGVDLVVLEADSPVVVQVKRRSRSSIAEPVSTVRHFLGAMLLKGEKRGTIVTTAQRFSKAASEAAIQAVTRKLVDRLDLIDLRRILDILALIRSSHDLEPWEAYLYETIHPRPSEGKDPEEVRASLYKYGRLQRRSKRQTQT